MGSLSARGADVTPALPFGQVLAVLAQEIDPERCRVLAAAGEDLQRIFVRSMFDWSPLAHTLRLDEFKRRLLAELLRRLQEGTWQLIWLPDDPTQPAMPITDDRQLAALGFEDRDVETSEINLGGRRHRVRVVTERRADLSERTTPPPPQGHAAAPSSQDLGEATSGTKPESPKDFAEAYLAKTSEPSKSGMWRDATAAGYQRRHGTQRDLWGYFPADVRSKGGRPRTTKTS